MEQHGQTIALNSPGPKGETALVVIDYEKKTVSYIEILPKNPQNKRVFVWEVQNYTQVAP